MEQKTQMKLKQILPQGYTSKLDIFQTERAIKLVKDTFERRLAEELNLLRVTAPRFLKVGKGLQDDLAGTQIPVRFKTKATDADVEMVHSLAKWKRYTLGRYDFGVGSGLYTDMDAVRKDEELSEIHSVYVDQWDWEIVISKEQRTLEFLKKIVRKIYKAMLYTEETVEKVFPNLKASFPKEIYFIHSEDLEEKYPDLTPKQREDVIAKEYGAVFIIGIGHPLESGEPHDVRAADYDDWCTQISKGKHGLNGDIIMWDATRKKCLEISSMGIRVDSESLKKQLEMLDLQERMEKEFHKGIIDEKLPLSIGGGIGQSRMCMLLLQRAHIGEVQSSVWPEEVIEQCEKAGVTLL